MFRLFGVVLFIAFSLPFLPVSGQTQPDTGLQTDTTKYKVYEFVEVHPEFPGGQEAMLLFLKEKISYVNMEKKPEGMSIIGFDITETGLVENIFVLKSLEPSLDQAAIEAVKQMPTWTPGRQKGEIVKVRYKLPVRFSKETGKSKTKTKRKN